MRQQSLFTYIPHPRLARRKQEKPPQTADERIGLNGRIGLFITEKVGTMVCAYVFAALAFVSFWAAIKTGDPVIIVAWISQTFFQLVLLPVIIVGQNIQGRVTDKRAIMTYEDAEAVLHEAQQIQSHLAVQDEQLMRTVESMERTAQTLALIAAHLGLAVAEAVRPADGATGTGS